MISQMNMCLNRRDPTTTKSSTESMFVKNTRKRWKRMERMLKITQQGILNQNQMLRRLKTTEKEKIK